eukprot:3934224-Rhodomonas_salina.2
MQHAPSKDSVFLTLLAGGSGDMDSDLKAILPSSELKGDGLSHSNSHEWDTSELADTDWGHHSSDSSWGDSSDVSSGSCLCATFATPCADKPYVALPELGFLVVGHERSLVGFIAKQRCEGGIMLRSR